MESNKNLLYIGLGVLALVVVGFMMLPENVVRPLLYAFLLIASFFLVVLVLIQRGRGGGLAGALGGMGGSSAFGTRAGDIFTRITIVSAALWILAAMALAKINVTGSQKYLNPAAPAAAGASGKQSPEAATGGSETESGAEEGSNRESSTGKPQSTKPPKSKGDSDSGSESP